MADLGYTVDVSQAEPYSVPPAGKAVAVEGACRPLWRGPLLMRTWILAFAAVAATLASQAEAITESEQIAFSGTDTLEIRVYLSPRAGG